MPDLSQNLPPIPPVTPGEEEAQSHLRRVRELLGFVEFFLELAYSRLPDPPDAEAMGTGEIPESLTFSLRGVIECATKDYVDPLHILLRNAVSETPIALALDWRKRHGKG